MANRWATELGAKCQSYRSSSCRGNNSHLWRFSSSRLAFYLKLEGESSHIPKFIKVPINSAPLPPILYSALIYFSSPLLLPTPAKNTSHTASIQNSFLSFFSSRGVLLFAFFVFVMDVQLFLE